LKKSLTVTDYALNKAILRLGCCLVVASPSLLMIMVEDNVQSIVNFNR